VKKKAIAFFDFDGTITFKDTLFEIITFQNGKAGLYRGLLAVSPWLLAMKLKIITNQVAKERLLSYFFKGMPAKDFQHLCDRFSGERLPALIRPGAFREIERLKKEDIPVVIVSASPENWISGWCKENNLICIATRLEETGNILTGKIAGKNCHGMEKVRRIREKFDLSAYTDIFCFGDTKGDKPMLSLATFAYYKPFRS
jgi:HAD superfamily hydrolase (TIGR01490 family)